MRNEKWKMVFPTTSSFKDGATQGMLPLFGLRLQELANALRDQLEAWLIH